MSNSIYNIQDYNPAITYLKHDIVKVGSNFYYAINDAPANALATHFAGTKGTQNTPVFLWVPSYNGQKNISPRVNSVQFGDGYEQRSPNGINNILLKMDYVFSERSLSEATAILHFLNQRKGVEWFYFTPERPYNQEKKFVCKEWTDTEVFYNNHSIRASFQEVAG